MIIGVPMEVKIGENRVGVVPAGVQALVDAGNRVLVQAGAGAGSGIPDETYRAAGAEIVADAAAAWGGADMVVKVKEPVAAEFALLRPGLVLFTYLHLAAARELTLALLEREVTAIAYETVEAADGSLPLLAPMSEVAGQAGDPDRRDAAAEGPRRAGDPARRRPGGAPRPRDGARRRRGRRERRARRGRHGRRGDAGRHRSQAPRR